MTIKFQTTNVLFKTSKKSVNAFADRREPVSDPLQLELTLDGSEAFGFLRVGFTVRRRVGAHSLVVQ